MKVLFLYPAWTSQYGIFAHFARKAAVFPPLNIAQLAALTEREGHEARIIDAEVDLIPLDQLVRMAVEYNPDLIALSGMTPFFHVVKKLAQDLKVAAPHIPITIGGPHFSIMREQIFTEEFDYGFIGQSDTSWPEFLRAYRNGSDLAGVRGLVFRKAGKIFNTGEPVFNDNLDSLPFPARHLLPMRKYQIGTMHGRQNFTSIQSIRGCPWECIFCASKALNTNRIARHSVEYTVNEIIECVEKYNIRHFMFVDDEVTLDRKHIIGICDLLEKKGIKITFEGNTRANLLDEELIVRLKRAGLVRLTLGLETVDEKVREIIKKRVPLEAYKEANRLMNKHGIEALNAVMLGLPGETRATIEKTLDFLSKAKDIKLANIAIAVPYPGTEFYEIAKSGRYGVQLLDDDFSRFRRYNSAVTRVNDLEPQDLIDLQNEGFVRIYSAYWRWLPMIHKHGVLGAALTFSRVFSWVFKKFLKKMSFKKTKQTPQIAKV